VRSAGEKSGAFYRADRTAIVPPKQLSARAKAIWKEIVAAKPLDWFDAGSVGLLVDHCRTQERLEDCWRALDRLPVGSVDANLVMRELRTLRTNYATSARLLRLAVSHGIERQAAKAAEKAPEAQGEALIGGQAAARFKVVA
jgi:hypothetical protein